MTIFLFSYMEKNIGVIRNENVSFVDLTSVNRELQAKPT